MPNTRRFATLAIGEALVVAVYVMGVVIDLDAPAAVVPLRIAVVVGALIIAATVYQAWSARPTTASLAGMLTALLGGACLASAAVSTQSGYVFASTPLATVGTVALIAAVVLGQVSQASVRGPKP